MGYAFLADVIVAVHVAYVSFVLLGQLAIVAGIVLKWGWVRNLWFRLAHLLAILVVAFESMLSITCPLTTWEDHFRLLAGQSVAQGSFIGRCLHNLMFFDGEPWVFNLIYIGFALLVLATFILAAPRRRRRAKVAQAPLPA